MHVIRSSNDIIFSRVEKTGCIHLNRPKSLNAVTHIMAKEGVKQLTLWANDPNIHRLLITGEGERAFCAGGDIKVPYHAYKRGNYIEGIEFLTAEYAFDDAISSFPKPTFSLMHGIVMGGGVGVGAHTQTRLLCDNAMVAMPECNIGLVPDVGSNFLLSRRHLAMGALIALTGKRLDAPSAIHANFADHLVNYYDYDAIIQAIIYGDDVEKFIKVNDDSWYNNCLHHASYKPILNAFSHHNVRDIMQALHGVNHDEALPLYHAMLANSPLSLALSLAILYKAVPMHNVLDVLRLEQCASARLATHPDFIEGVRAAVVDKDKKPIWSYNHDDNIDDATIAQYTSPLTL